MQFSVLSHQLPPRRRRWQCGLLATAVVFSASPHVLLADHDTEPDAAAAAEAIAPSRLSDGYMNHAALTQRVRAMARENTACRLSEIGRSQENRAIYLLTLSSDHDTHNHRSALLITAGLDGRHWVGTETAVRVAENLLTNHADLLQEMTVYIVPRVNPDGTELNFGPLNMGHIGTLRAVDLDRDGAVNEDGPNDLNGDGVITMMRQANPSLQFTPTHVIDPNEPRLMKTPDWTKGERATHVLFKEGLDDDGDGLIAEDGIGGVDLDRNFMHLWPEYSRDAGTHQLSEPESLALATFVLDHPNIALAITYGRHDNMINVPDHRGRDINRRVVTGIEEGDKPLYDELSKLFKETTGQKNAPREDLAGSFHAWLYAQRAVPSVATVVWGRPDVDDASDNEKDGDAGTTQPAPQEAADVDPVTGTWQGTLDLSAMSDLGDGPPMGEMDITITLTHDGGGQVRGTINTDMGPMDVDGSVNTETLALSLIGQTGGAEVEIALSIADNAMTGQASVMGMGMPIAAERQAAAPAAAPAAQRPQRSRAAQGQPADAEAAAWLAYSDSRGGIGFVEWTDFDHPQFGRVQIGGFVPGFKMNPPAEELDELAGKQTAFAVALMDKRPRLRIQGPEVKRLAPNMYEVRMAIVNDGWLPTKTAMGARARAVLPTVMRISTPVDQILNGNKVNRAWRIDSFSREDMYWMLAVNDGEAIELELLDDQLGDRIYRFTADENTTVTETPLEDDRR